MLRWIVPVNIGLALLITAGVAKISSDLIAFRLGKVFPQTGKKAAAPVSAPSAPEDLASYSPILEKGLFGKATQGKLSPVVAAAATATAAPAAGAIESDLLLLGTVLGSYRQSFALIQRRSTKEERVFRLGDTVFDMGALASVQKETAEIETGGRRVKIYSPTAAGEAAALPSAPPPPQGSGGGLASQIGAGSYVIDQRALNAALDNIGQAMTDARLLPSVKEGKVEGFRVSEVKPQGIFGTIGIKNGDVLLRINDFPIDSPEKAIQSFAALKGLSRIKLDLIRDGQPATFTYDIR
ncbi:type II secretion system protein GspC [Geobacter sp. DSM 9736]|uniref:type II secretion system protein GspC n=1 Tax=Geobacter sp. DSM 9736 TaxID=1277350 RepID=UPI000B505352|nr:type II secretion system protein GspC [Geobacter sp. DSM 9736]SNB47422.1 general secretion pathway protein C [Geobacter sp. DSM 9736]